MVEDLTDDALTALFEACDNTGRWGPDDEAGTLNLIDEAVRVAAAREVVTGHVIALGRRLEAGTGAVARHPVVHHLLHSAPDSAVDLIAITPHDPLITHVDALGHVFWRGRAYNGRSRDVVVGRDRLLFGDVAAAARGVFTRGVLLDVTTDDHPWLAADEYVTVADLEAAERRAGVEVRTGDAVFVHTGRERRARAEGDRYSPIVRAGLHAEVMPWLHRRGAAVSSGDCTERMPYPSDWMPFPVHQIGVAAMGLCLLDAPHLEAVLEHCSLEGRWTFALTFAPVHVSGATGFPVNPLAVF